MTSCVADDRFFRVAVWCGLVVSTVVGTGCSPKTTPPPKPPEKTTPVVDPLTDAKQRLREAARYSAVNDATPLLKDKPELAKDTQLMSEVLPGQIARGRKEFVELAIQSNPDLVKENLNRPGDYATPPLHIVVEQGNRELAAAILKKSPGIEKSLGGGGETILQAAIQHQRLEMIKFLVEQYPEVVTAKGALGDTALHSAVQTRLLWKQRQILDVVALLVKAAPNLSQERNSAGQTPAELVNELQEVFRFSEFEELKPEVTRLLGVSGAPAGNS